jgi:5-methylcytosine-specific restriction endonuclease McrA
MSCCIAGCDKPIQYKADELCQMHYIRRRRNGTFELKPNRAKVEKRQRKTQYVNQNGYVTVWAEKHPLANSKGLVREHRRVYYDERNAEPAECELCQRPINWRTLHIDHIDNNPGNNSIANLRALCRACNVFRGHTAASMEKHIFEVDGIRMGAMAWARMSAVKVAGQTIIRRRRRGMTDLKAVFGARKTHKHTATKVPQTKYDAARGLPANRDWRSINDKGPTYDTNL